MDSELVYNKKLEIKKLLSNVFVEKYDFFKDKLDEINNVFKKYNIDYDYRYNDFCVDYINRCNFYIDNNPSLDISNMYLYAIIVSDIVKNKMNEYNIEYE